MSKKITLAFEYEGKKYKKVGYFTDNMQFALEIDENDAGCSVEYNEDGYTTIPFYDDDYLFEVEFPYDSDTYETHWDKPTRMLVWSNGDNGCLVGDIANFKFTFGNSRKKQPTRHR